MSRLSTLSRQTLVQNVNKLPYVRRLYQENKEYAQNACYRPGHFYSPIVAVAEIKEREEQVWANVGKKELNGINLNEADQVALFRSFVPFLAELPFPMTKQPGMRYHLDNEFYPFIDGLTLYGMIRKMNPKRIIEMGSGYSSALMLDVNERFYNGAMQLTFIEPNAERLYSLLAAGDRNRERIFEQRVQDVPLDVFRELEAGDFLFIDSSHVSKTGSDVNYLLFEVLPILKPGVFIHFHDIFYPFEYVKQWVYEGRNWNENYILRAFLMYNNSYQIRLFTHFLHLHHKELFEAVPFAFRYKGVNLWIEKTAA